MAGICFRLAGSEVVSAELADSMVVDFKGISVLAVILILAIVIVLPSSSSEDIRLFLPPQSLVTKSNYHV